MAAPHPRAHARGTGVASGHDAGVIAATASPGLASGHASNRRSRCDVSGNARVATPEPCPGSSRVSGSGGYAGTSHAICAAAWGHPNTSTCTASQYHSAAHAVGHAHALSSGGHSRAVDHAHAHSCGSHAGAALCYGAGSTST